MNSGVNLITFKDLKIRNMVRRPKAKQGTNGKWLKNSAKAKAGLSTAILSSARGPGPVANFTDYKAARRNVLVAYVPAHHTSQQRSKPSCWRTAPENR